MFLKICFGYSPLQFLKSVPGYQELKHFYFKMLKEIYLPRVPDEEKCLKHFASLLTCLGLWQNTI